MTLGKQDFIDYLYGLSPADVPPACPQCGETLVFVNIGYDTWDVYCEDCGWPNADFGVESTQD